MIAVTLLPGILLVAAVSALPRPQDAFEPSAKTISQHEVNEGMIEGDILSNIGDEHKIDGRNGRRGQQWRWPNHIIPYDISSSAHYNEFEQQVLKFCFLNYARYTCIRWQPRQSQRDYVHIFDGPGCFSFVGRQGGAQQLSLKRPSSSSPGTCMIEGIAEHEMMHASGFYHEQSRHDRDDFVTVFFENIQPGREHNFAKLRASQEDNLGTHYDYGALMHYGNLSFSKDPANLKYTILPKMAGAEIGQRRGLSTIDVFKLNHYYGCDVPHNVPQPMDAAPSDPTQCNFDDNWCGWTQDYKVALDGSTGQFDQYTDEFDFYQLHGSTPSSGTGPNHDHSGSGKYIYAEASFPRTQGNRARIRSAKIQGSGAHCVSFYYNMYSKNSTTMGDLNLFTLEAGSTTRMPQGSLHGPSSTDAPMWKKHQFSFTSSKMFQVIFEAVVGSAYLSDIAIDDFAVTSGAC